MVAKSPQHGARDGRGVFVSSLTELMQWGLRGAALPRRRASSCASARCSGFWRCGASRPVSSSLLKLFNPIFLAGPWLVLGKMRRARGERPALGAPVGDDRARHHRLRNGRSRGACHRAARRLLPGRRKVVEPVVEMLRPIPPLAMLPLFIVWIGIGEGSKIGFITYATFFPMFLTTVHAVQQVDPLAAPGGEEPGRAAVAALPRVILPAALPEILTGIRLGMALAFFVIVISEFIGAEQGLGYLINDGRNFFLVPQMLGRGRAPRSPRVCQQRAHRPRRAPLAPMGATRHRRERSRPQSPALTVRPAWWSTASARHSAAAAEPARCSRISTSRSGPASSSASSGRPAAGSRRS